jgi:peptidoglycan/LPS O-acetylase OafA/YrhL
MRSTIHSVAIPLSLLPIRRSATGTRQPTARLPPDGTRDQAASRTPRLAWLDALRGVGALCVVYQHFGARVFPAVHAVVYRAFDPGLYGVLVFFLISGYIVPASLERKGSVRSFWISRLFRLFPLFGCVIAITLVLNLLGLASLRGTSQNVAASVLSHLLMLSDLLGTNNVLAVIWTLSYEMVFYLLLTALYTARLHQRSGTFAIAFAAGALVLGGTLPTIWLSDHTFGPTAVALTSDILVLTGLAAALAGRRRLSMLGTWLAAGTGLILLVFNERRFAYEGLTILALMFTGTLLYRAQQGQISHRRAVAIAVTVFAAAIGAGAWHIPAVSAADPGRQQVEWIVSVALAGLTFAAGLAVKDVRVPRVLAWLGLVSYSVYLLLPVLLDLYDSLPFGPSFRPDAWLQAAMTAAFLAALLSCAAATHSLIEAPMQRLGRRVAARIDSPRQGRVSAPALAMVREPSGSG